MCEDDPVVHLTAVHPQLWMGAKAICSTYLCLQTLQAELSCAKQSLVTMCSAHLSSTYTDMLCTCSCQLRLSLPVAYESTVQTKLVLVIIYVSLKKQIPQFTPYYYVSCFVEWLDVLLLFSMTFVNATGTKTEMSRDFDTELQVFLAVPTIYVHLKVLVVNEPCFHEIFPICVCY